MKATVARRLEEAGAVLVAKLTLGALALGDQWFGGMTRNPWNPAEGSSGSSAGSTSAVVAGLVGFAIGSETLGSIVSPCRRCSASGLRPTFGRVSRYGCMTLSWSMDKLGPIARSIEDCALVFGAIHGSDGLDITAVDRPFAWPPRRDVRSLKVGYFEERPAGRRAARARDVLKDLGVKLVPIKLPDKYPVESAHADPQHRSRRRVRRPDPRRRPRGHRPLGQHVPHGPVRPRRRVPPRLPHPHARDARDGGGHEPASTPTSAATT